MQTIQQRNERDPSEDEMSSLTTINQTRELASRANDGLTVTLFWVQGTSRLAVSVSDKKTGDRFVLRAESSNALEVFYHPFAHAARRGIEYQTGGRDPERGEAAYA
ncbi:MAG: hypothetical protein ACRDKU_04165 [Gaiellaceae bacterium]